MSERGLVLCWTGLRRRSLGVAMRLISVLVVVSLLGGVLGAVQAAEGAPDYARERAESAKALTQPYGWFSLVALEWLKPGRTTVGSAKDSSVVLAGAPAHLLTLEQKDGKVMVVDVAPGLTLRGQPISGGGAPIVLGDDESDAAALSMGTLRMWAIDRGGKRYLRVKDSNAPALKHFHGLRWYAPDAKYRVEARWVPYTTPHTMNVMNKLGQITPVPAPGYVEFEMDGRKLTLTPMTAGDRGLWFVFRDATFRQTTDGGGRFLTTEAPSNGLTKAGTVVLDFNEAENPPCAYSPYATCPLAAPENRLAVAVMAGEKRYEE